MSALNWLMQQLGGDPEAAGAAQTSTAMQPSVLQHLRNVLGDMPERLGSGVSYDSNRSLAQNTLDPESLQQATNVAMSAGPGAIRAYHGSPHDFDAFDMSKIGTGEGAQAYGHGLYFAENEGVARQYRDNLGRSRNLAGVEFNPDGTPNRAGMVAKYLDGNIPEDRIRLGLATLEPGASNKQLEGWLAEGRRLFDDATKSSKMYEVNLHADPASLLDWDRPLGEQSKAIRSLLEPKVEEAVRKEYLTPVVHPAEATGQDAYGAITSMFPWDYVGPRTDKMQASALFREGGIPGIKYLDQGSRDAGGGTSNYVMFDDKLIEILRKYGLAGLTAGTGAAALGGSAEAAPADALSRIRQQLGEGAF